MFPNSLMDKFVEDPVVNLDDDNSTTDESGGEEHDELGDKNGPAEVNASGDQYKRITDLTADDIWSLEFGSEEAAYQFYSRYARCIGFAVRKEAIGRDSVGNRNRRLYVCSRHGLRNSKYLTRVDRKRESRPLIRTKCLAKLRIRLDYGTLKWKVSSFVESHNHELTPSKYVHLIPRYRVMTAADKAQIYSFHSYEVRTCHIMGYMVAQKGGHANVGFVRKDLYNYLDVKKRVQVKDGDARTALSYLEGKANSDPMFYSKLVVEDGRLKHLFWADGGSISDFQCFGDVLAFDTTYKRNKYNNPLVIFSGCNHHSQIVVFGCALVENESTETYKWVLDTFLDAMCHKHPKAIMTDGDHAMREAIKHVFSGASHRLCAWHLHNNAFEHVKDSDFLKEFKKAMYSNFTPDQFEEYWRKMIKKYGVENNT
ncbi:hypothetical protein RIF29_33858 [Crotalaria pallida]|uniref:Protein FAR1-RELATED SEQUENCE n=1 Tax=Crotalaria pallida TaxID=3830 RepID=A0AAN9E8R7_CROPI